MLGHDACALVCACTYVLYANTPSTSRSLAPGAKNDIDERGEETQVEGEIDVRWALTARVFYLSRAVLDGNLFHDSPLFPLTSSLASFYRVSTSSGRTNCGCG